jgi:hypothetical protein
VHGGDNDIEPGQHAIGQIQFTVVQDGHLDALEQRDALHACVEGVDLRTLLRQMYCTVRAAFR